MYVRLAMAALVLLVATTGKAATLMGGFYRVAPGSNVNLTAAGPIDWVHWGLYTDTSVDRKAGVIPQISDFTLLGSSGGFLAAYQFNDLAHSYRWSDGTPNSTVTNTTTGVWAYGFPAMGSGFELRVPADTTPKTLHVFVGTYAAIGRFEASLSGLSYTDTLSPPMYTPPRATSTNGVFSLTFASDIPGEMLIIRYTLFGTFGGTASPNVTLQSAALTAEGVNNPPFAAITNPVSNTKYTAPANITIAAKAHDFDGSINLVEFFANGNKIGEDSVSPYAIAWSPSAGVYLLTATATDNAGASAASAPVEIFVNGSGGTLVASRSNSPTRANLTTEGTLDWAHWGLDSTTAYTHKSGVPQQISNLVVLGSAPVQNYTNNMTLFSWSDGTPVGAATDTPTGIFVSGTGEGFELKVPADQTSRRLRIYAGLYGARANFQAYLSDFSAPAHTDTGVSNIYGDSYVVFTIDYAAASAGQHLIVRYRAQELYDFDFGNVTLQAATLHSTNSIPTPIWVSDPRRLGNDFSFSFDTEGGKIYRGQYTLSFSPIDWQTFTNVNGNGTRVTVTNQLNGNPACFYRVAQP
jgi:hypothetical protein